MSVEIKELAGGQTSIRHGAVTNTVQSEDVIQYADWMADGERRFGPDTLGWRFICPHCHHAAAVREFPEESRYGAGTECIGRSVPGRGCNWSAGGLLAGPLWVLRPDGDEMRAIPVFRFAAPAAP